MNIVCKSCNDIFDERYKFCGNCGLKFTEGNYSEVPAYEYNATLDINTCDVCRELNGKRGKVLTDLPKTPNHQCRNASCRCFLIAVFD